MEDDDFVDPAADKLLDRLLYWGVLPRYAFPTDVAPFYVFNRALSTPYRPKMEFAPSQGLNIALSQYAPNKQIWIKGKQYTSKAIFSPYRHDRRDAWGRRRLYFECSRCGHAKTEDYADDRRNAVVACEACQLRRRPLVRLSHGSDHLVLHTPSTAILSQRRMHPSKQLTQRGPSSLCRHLHRTPDGFLSASASAPFRRESISWFPILGRMATATIIASRADASKRLLILR